MSEGKICYYGNVGYGWLVVRVRVYFALRFVSCTFILHVLPRSGFRVSFIVYFVLLACIAMHVCFDGLHARG